MSAHIPGPWHVGEGKAAEIIYAADGYAVASTVVYHGAHAGAGNAERIVRCVNAHDDLVAALRDARSHLKLAADFDPNPHAAIDEAIARADVALAKAEG